MITRERLKEALEYNIETGIFRWKIAPRGHSIGRVAVRNHGGGYIQIRIDGEVYLAHRLAWFYVHGEWPRQIDHINGIRDDNRIANLRLATQTQNNANSRKRQHVTSHLKGVCWDKKKKKWRSSITFFGRHIFLGRFSTQEEAHGAYAAAAVEYFGEYARVY